MQILKTGSTLIELAVSTLASQFKFHSAELRRTEAVEVSFDIFIRHVCGPGFGESC